MNQETSDQSDEGTWANQQQDNDKDKTRDKDKYIQRTPSKSDLRDFVTFETFDQSEEDTWPDQQKDK